jgi:hypothetical protein
VGRGEDLVAGFEGEPAVHGREPHRGAVGERVLARCSARVRRRSSPHGRFPLEAGQQRGLGVGGQLVAVAVDGRLQGRCVRGEDERRELRELGVEQELRAHRVPVLRVELVGRRRRGCRVGRRGVVAADQERSGSGCHAGTEEGTSRR